MHSAMTISRRIMLISTMKTIIIIALALIIGVGEYMLDSQDAEIATRINAPESSVSARIRDLRKAKHGGYLIERQYVERGLNKYKMAMVRA